MQGNFLVNCRHIACAFTSVLALLGAAQSQGVAKEPVRKAPVHNVVLFVADGLRYASVTPDTAPTMFRLKSEGVDFTNSHAMYPTLTTANASAIATGHYLGDTGDYANVLFTGFPVAAKGGANVVFLEDDAVLQEMKQHFARGYMGPVSLICAAARAGYATAIIGKAGPAAIQGLDCLDSTIVLDDFTNRPRNPDGTATGAIALDADLSKQIAAVAGADQPPASGVPNRAQQTWFLAAATKAVLPALQKRGKPFVLLFWSRDPDGSQHGEQDSPGAAVPGINGPTGHAGIANADSDLKGLLDTLDSLSLAKTTDIFVTADHGFSTIAKSVPDENGDLPPPSHPSGFLALDVASWLGQKIFDPDASNSELDPASGDHPARGNGLIGPSPDAPQAVVAANGGSDFIYAPGPDAREHAKLIFAKLLEQPYVGGLFVADEFLKTGDPHDFAGALPLSDIRLDGSASVPRPAIVVGFRSFPAKGCALGPELCAVELADTSLATGQGMHGSFSRADTRNFMAATGPDFKTGFADTAPVGNADIAPTLAQILRLPLGETGGRPIREALKGGKAPVVKHNLLKAASAANGLATILDEQQVGQTVYFDAAGFPGRVVGLQDH